MFSSKDETKLIEGLNVNIAELKDENEKLQRKLDSQREAIRDLKLEQKATIKELQLELKEQLFDKTSTLKDKHREELQKVKDEYMAKTKKLEKDNYDKFKDHIVKVTEEGTPQTKFVSDMALKMIDKMGKYTAPSNQLEYDDE